jgi:hypothetical protein
LIVANTGDRRHGSATNHVARHNTSAGKIDNGIVTVTTLRLNAAWINRCMQSHTHRNLDCQAVSTKQLSIPNQLDN